MAGSATENTIERETRLQYKNNYGVLHVFGSFMTFYFSGFIYTVCVSSLAI